MGKKPGVFAHAAIRKELKDFCNFRGPRCSRGYCRYVRRSMGYLSTSGPANGGQMGHPTASKRQVDV